MTSQPPRNSFRASVLSGERPKLVLTQKAGRLDSHPEASEADLEPSLVSRSEVRRVDHRGGDRHRLEAETAIARYEGSAHEVEVINLSAGGAMIRASFKPRLWDIVELELGEGPGIESAVRWLRDGFIGLEFAHETRIDCDPRQRAALLLEVIQRSFPDSAVDLGIPDEPEPEPEAEQEDLGNRAEKRHPLIWRGEIHFTNGTNAVRLRNVSAGGAQVEVEAEYPVGAEVLLDLGEAGQFFAKVSWVHGTQVGLKFNEPFDVDCLAKARPEVVSPHRWLKIDFGNEATEDSTPWEKGWNRGSLSDLRTDLEGYLGR